MITKYLRTHPAFFKDSLLIGIMAVLAGCGLVYQYIIAQYAGRVLGLMEHAIFTIIGVMIVSMGLGAFAAKSMRHPHSSFAWLELLISVIGSLSVLFVAFCFYVSFVFPQILAENFGLPEALIPYGSLSKLLTECAMISPYLVGFMLGFLIGMEIPLIARIREQIYGKHLVHNIGTIYGADYIGAGIGAAIYVFYMMRFPVEYSAIATAWINLLVGMVFLACFYNHIKWKKLFFLCQIIFSGILIVFTMNAKNWHSFLEDSLYLDRVVYAQDTSHQHITITKRYISNHQNPIYNLYLNGHTQFSSIDEHMYHQLLVCPPLLASASTNNILIIGGGDGLAVRDVLKWNPEKITLLELDKEMISLFRDKNVNNDGFNNQVLLDLNEYSLSDKKVEIIYGDAFNKIDEFFDKGQFFDTIIIDLPDPSNPNLNKLYSVSFYQKLHHLLAADGALAVQSTSPYHTKEAFLTIGVTLKHAGFAFVEPYHHNIPTFGEWGWTIAVKQGRSALQRIKESSDQRLDHYHWVTKDLILSTFIFGKDFFENVDKLEPNRIGSHLLYFLYTGEWSQKNSD